jgi:CRP-like cAMP-binding protein
MLHRENLILAALHKGPREAIAADLRAVTLRAGQVLCEPSEPPKWAYFPETAAASVVRVMADSTVAEVGVIGREGFVGLEAILRDGGPTTLNVCQIPGTALAIRPDALRGHIERGGEIAAHVLRFVGGYCTMLGQLIACNRLHRVDQRYARWMLMIADRTGRQSFSMTHERLSMMLGARRPTVTATTALLRDAGCIETSRGRVHIRDRTKLESYACECYDICVACFA